MVAFIRQFLVLLLVLLQFAAPLVHAHVDDSGAVSGFHLHEFESLNIQSKTLLDSSSAYSDTVQLAIVDLGAAIKHQQPAPDGEDSTTVYYLFDNTVFLLTQHTIDVINFSPHDFDVTKEPFPSQNLTRAPPV